MPLPRARPPQNLLRQPEDRPDRVQGLHLRGTTPIRPPRRELHPGRTQISRTSAPGPQSPTPQLHETPRHPPRPPFHPQRGLCLFTQARFTFVLCSDNLLEADITDVSM